MQKERALGYAVILTVILFLVTMAAFCYADSQMISKHDFSIQPAVLRNPKQYALADDTITLDEIYTKYAQRRADRVNEESIRYQTARERGEKIRIIEYEKRYWD